MNQVKWPCYGVKKTTYLQYNFLELGNQQSIINKDEQLMDSLLF